MNRHYEKAGVPHKTRVIGFRVTDQELQKIKDAQSALRSIGISGTTSGIDDMNQKFEKFLHDSEYQKMNEKITKLTSERSSHDDLWREIDINK